MSISGPLADHVGVVRPRLLFLSTVHPSPATPGMGTFNARLVAQLTEWWDTTALVPVPWRATARLRSAAPIDLTYRATFPRFWYLPTALGRPTHGAALVCSIRQDFTRWSRSGPAGLVLSYWAYPDSDAAGRLAADARLPSATIVGGSDVLVLARTGANRERMRRALLRHSAVFAVGEHLAAAVRDLGVPKERVHVFGRGVDGRLFGPADRNCVREQWGIPPSTRLVLWVGRFEKVKDLPTLVRAIAEIGSERRPMLALVGDGSRRRAIESLATALGVHLVTPGFVPPATLRYWYAAADVFALSSRSEGTPNVLLEAAACGAPIVTTDAGGAGALARQLHGQVVPVGDHRQLAAAISAALTGDPRRAKPAIPTARAAAAALSGQLQRLLPMPPAAL